MRPKKFNNKRKQKTIATTQHDLGSDSRDEIKVTTMGFKGKDSSTSYSSNLNETQHGKKIIYLFHIRVISKHTNQDIYFV